LIDTVWIVDAAPAGAAASGEAAVDATQVARGNLSLSRLLPPRSNARTRSPEPRVAGDSGELADPRNPPRQILVTWSDGTTQWTASFGESRIDPTLAQPYAARNRSAQVTRICYLLT
jgi:hypothetical protein